MGSNQSSHTNAETKEVIPSSEQLKSSGSVRGRKSLNSDIDVTPKTRSVDNDALFVYTSDSEESEDIETDDEEFEAVVAERRMILEEAKMLKAYATFHLHPENSVESNDQLACGRNFFARPSAPEQESLEEAEERAMILEEAAMLKKYAEFHLHPEKPVETTDAYACGRNYFTRASADEFYGEEEAAEREQIMQECADLKKYAGYHLHPEKPVASEGSMLSARCYYERASAPEQESLEEAEERATVLEEAAMLKKYAEFHLHPEKPVETTDAYACGRNYFTRASADEFYGEEEAAEREQIMQECADLKKYAGYHLHPEKPVASEGSMLSARCYYERASAPEQESLEEAEERATVLEEAAMLKKYAEFHLHPEKPVETTDAYACGRSYFDRFSAARSIEAEDKSEPIREYSEPIKAKTKVFQPATKHASGEDGNKEEEGMTRSPSSIMLYGFEDNEAF